jgi:hypothetical protein
MLKFPDGTQVRLIGLNQILAELYYEGRPVSRKTGEEIVDRLEAGKNYIPSSELIRREYRHLLLKEYKEYVSSRADPNAEGVSDSK